MKLGSIVQFLLIGIIVGALLPFFISLCLFGTTLQTFVAPPAPTAGYWSGSATPVPTPVPGQVQILTNNALTSSGGAIFLLWNILGALVGEGLALWRWGNELDATRRAWLGAVVGCLIFFVISLFGFVR